MVEMITPREDFQKSKYAKGWLDVCDSTQFTEATKTALLEMQLRFRNTQDTGTTFACQKKIEGAILFLETLTSLTLPAPEQPGPMPSENLERL